MKQNFLQENEKNRKPPRLRLPKYDLKRNVQPPDSTWDEYSPIKTMPTLLSPQSPRFQDFYNSHRIDRSPEREIPSLSLNIKEKEPFILDEKEQILTEPKFIPNNQQTQEINQNSLDKNKEQEIPKPKFIEEPKFTPIIQEQNDLLKQENILFLPKEFENIKLIYRPFGCFGLSR